MKHTSTYFPWVKRGVSKDVFACFVPLGGNKRWNFSESRKWGVCTVGISAGPAGAVCGVGAAVHTAYNTWSHVISATVWIESGLHSQGNAILQKWSHRISICDHLYMNRNHMKSIKWPKPYFRRGLHSACIIHTKLHPPAKWCCAPPSNAKWCCAPPSNDKWCCASPSNDKWCLPFLAVLSLDFEWLVQFVRQETRAVQPGQTHC